MPSGSSIPTLDRARTELSYLERLSRDALADVRRAVSGYREASLYGEIARARLALDAAGIAAELPQSADEAPTQLREPFAWAVREGVTNVVRHSDASHCRVTVSPRGVEVVDDGRGPGAGIAGNGLAVLRERAAAVHATVMTEALDPGYALRVLVGDG